MPRSGWGPGTLLRVGASTAAVGFRLMVPAVPSAPLTVVLLYVGVGVVAPGTGTATPGFTAGAGLQVTPAEQGGVAGLVTAAMGLTMVLAPTTGTLLYELGGSVPVIAGGRRHRAGGRGGIRQSATAGGVLPGGAGNYSGSLRSGLSSSSMFTSL